MPLVKKQERLQLARAVSRGDFAHLLDEHNVAGPGVRLEGAVASGQPYFVTPRRDLLTIDMDLPDDPRRSADVMSSFDILMDAARRAGVPHVSVPSGRPGHQHGYLVVGSGTHRVRLERWCRSRGLDVRTSGIRPPGTPHRITGELAWSTSVDVRTVTSALTSPVDEQAAGRLANQLCPVELPGRVQVAVRHGHARAGYDSPSHARMALAVAVRARGGGPGLVEAILRDPSSPLGQTFRGKGAGWQRAEVVRIWDKAGAWIAAGGRPAPGEHLRRVYAAASRWAWRGTSGGSDLAVLEELVRCGAAVPTTVVGVSLGDLAVGAGVGVDTARAALKRLAAAGWVRVSSQETARTTRTYALLVPDTADLSQDPTDDLPPERDDLGDLGADIARRGGLGKVSVRVARALRQSPGARTGDLAAALSMTGAAVRYHLRKLAGAGMAVSSGAGWLLTWGREMAADLSEAFGVAGARQRQADLVAAARAARQSARRTFAKLRRWSHAAKPLVRPGPPLLA